MRPDICINLLDCYKQNLFMDIYAFIYLLDPFYTLMTCFSLPEAESCQSEVVKHGCLLYTSDKHKKEG